MSKLLDANAILRYLLNDIESQAQQVEDAIRNGAFTIPEVIAEVVYVLTGVYEVSRSETAETLKLFLNEISISEKPVISYALSLYADSGLDYVDCILVARNIILKQEILTFDKKLNNKIARLANKR